MKLISWENKPIFTEIVLLFKENKIHIHMVKGIISAFDRMDGFGHKSDIGGNCFKAINVCC